MADEAQRASSEPGSGDVGRTAEFDEGRYVFCVVRLDPAAEDPSFSAEGIDGREAGLVVEGDLAAVAHPCESLFDASDPATVRRWLLRHQAVVDAAGEAFGTPLPFRFDTVVVGDDERVREWLRENADRIHAALDDLAGTWEYRIEVAVDEEATADALEEDDERLASLAAKIREADEGRAFLHEKQYDERLRELGRQRREARAEDLIDRIEPLAERVEWADATSTATSFVEAGGSGDAETDSDGTETATPATSVTVLATPEAAEAIGEELDVVADEPGVEVRYTGPWPPYTFAPAIDAEDDR